MRKLRHLILTVAFFICTINLYAAKIIGYNTDIRVVKNSGGTPTNNSIIRIVLYTDNTLPNITTTSFNGTLYLNSTNAVAGTYAFTKVSANGYYVNYPATSCDLGEFQNTQVLIFESNITTTNLTNTAGYYLSFNFCCRTDTLKNLPTVVNRNFTGTIELPALGTSNTYRYNSSPSFVNLPLTRFCVNRPARIFWNATDPDGDSLVYSIVNPLANDNIKPYTNYNFANGYSLSNVIGGHKPLTINSQTGELNFIPSLTGRFSIAVKVSEYRAGVKIGEIRRELDIRVLNECTSELPPKIVNSSIQNSQLDEMLDITNSKELLFRIEDAGLAKDSLFISMTDDVSNGALPFSALDTSLYEWNFYNQNGNLIFKSNDFINIDWKSNCIIGLELNPKLNTPINQNYGFKLTVKDNSCYVRMVDSVNVKVRFSRQDSILSEPNTVNVNKGQLAKFSVTSKHLDNISYKWQVNHELGFEDISPRSKYIGINSDSLTVSITELSDHRTYYRCILYGIFNNDTSNVVGLILNDSCKFVVLDTLGLTVYDTTKVIIEIQQTRIIEDTLYVPKFTYLNLDPKNYISVYPNPVENKLFFVSNEVIKSATVSIFNSLGQIIAVRLIDSNEVDVSYLEPGVYTFILLHNGIRYLGKFVK